MAQTEGTRATTASARPPRVALARAAQGQAGKEAAVSEASTNPRHSPEVDEADPIYQAMKAAAASAPPPSHAAPNGRYACPSLSSLSAPLPSIGMHRAAPSC